MHARLFSMRTFSKHIYEIDANPAHGNRISNTLTYVQNVFQDNFLYYYFFRSSRLLGRSFARSLVPFDGALAFNQFGKNVINKMTFYYG